MLKDFSELNVLLFDMDKGYQSLLGTQLNAQGVGNISGVSNLDDALSAFRLHRINVAVVENYPPFIRYLRNPNKRDDPKIPIVVLSTVKSKDDVYQIRDAGAHEFVAKPTSPGVLLDHIMHAVNDTRTFIDVIDYYGPDRRRRRKSKYNGPERRHSRAN